MLVSKVITITDTPVELLAGEDTGQAYALTLTGFGLGSVYVGGPDVSDSSLRASDLGAHWPLVIQGESFWAVADTGVSAITGVLAYSTPGD